MSVHQWIVSTTLTSFLLVAAVPTPAFGQGAKTERETGGHQLKFSGKAYVQIPKLRYDGSHPITMEAIVTPNASHSSKATCVVGDLQRAGVGIHFKNGKFRFYVNDGRKKSKGYASAVADEKADLHKPVHVAGVYDGKRLMLFVDGKLQRKTSSIEGKPFPSPHGFLVGADPNDQGKPHQFFTGIIDEVRISKTARYTKNFTPTSKKHKADKDTMVLYHFDEGNGTQSRDDSVNAYHGKIHHAKWDH